MRNRLENYDEHVNGDPNYIVRHYDTGDKEWFKIDKSVNFYCLHREDGPACEHTDGRKEWWVNGLRHREDGPAIIEPSGTELWYKEGYLHKVNGPAVTYSDGEVEYWFEGIQWKRMPTEDDVVCRDIII